MSLSRDLRAHLRSSALVLMMGLSLSLVANASTPTSTTLTLLPSASVKVGSPVTLSAKVLANGKAVHPGTVVFCNASAARCDNLAILGQAQLTSAGIAQVHLRLGAGTHSITAMFQATPHSATPLASSTSTPVTLTVNGLNSDSAAIAASGVAGNFKLTATLTAYGTLVPTGTFSFIDHTGGNALVGSASLSAGLKSVGLTPEAMPAIFNLTTAVVGDFNGDGIPDMAVSGLPTNPGGNTSEAITILLGNGDGTFTIGSTPEVGPDPYPVAVVDANGDGIPDLVVGNSGGITVGFTTMAVLLGKGDGTFQLSTRTSEFPPNVVQVTDLNGDGIPDIAMTTNFFDSPPKVITLLGDGAGGFSVKSTIDTFQAATGIATGDFNMDGIPDLAVTDAFANTVTILLGNGDGTVTPGATFAVGKTPVTIVEADFNGDGIPDLAVTSGFDPTISILLGVGDGTFVVQPPRSVNPAPTTLNVGDFNGDGIADLAVGGQPGIILLGKGDGTFTNSTQFDTAPTGFDTNALAVADLNGDGLPDIITSIETLLANHTVAASIKGLVLSGAGVHQVVASYSGDDSYSPAVSAPVAISNTTGTPVLHPEPRIYTSVQMVTVTDSTPSANVYYTLDGSTPMATSTPFTSPVRVTGQTVIRAIAISPNAAPSAVITDTYIIQLPPPTISPASSPYLAPLTVTIAPDPSCSTLACAIYYTLDGKTPTVSSTRYTKPITLTALGTVTVKAIEIAPDFVASKAAAETYTIASPTETVLSVVPARTVSLGASITLAARMINSGVPLQHGRVVFCNASAPRCEDAAVFGEAQIASNGTATLHLRLGEGAYSIQAVFQGTPHTPVPQLRSASTPIEITVTGAEPTITPPAIVSVVSGEYTFRNTIAAFGRPTVGGTVSFFDSINGGSPVSLGSVPINPRQSAVGFATSSSYHIGTQLTSVATGDFNNDGIPDAVVVDSEINALWVLLGNGDGTFTILPPQSFTTQPDVVKVGDFNSDGIQDLAITLRNDNKIEILLGNGDGTFTVSSTPATGRGPQDFIIGDLNGDGIPDIATGDLDGSTMTVLLGKGDGTFVSHVQIRLPGEPFSIAAADFNGDGTLDLATIDFANDGVFTFDVWLGDGNGNFSLKSRLVIPDSDELNVGDFNGDGIPDLVAGYSTVTAFIGNGDGTFRMQPILSGSLTTIYQGISLADFNGDGKTDIEVTRASYNSLGGVDEALLILLANGDGTFITRTFTQIGNSLSATADFNGDGVPDLVLPKGSGNLTFVFGNQAFKSAVTGVTLQGGVSHSISIDYSGSQSYLPSASKAVTVTPP